MNPARLLAPLALVLLTALFSAGCATNVKTVPITYELDGQKFNGVYAWDDSSSAKRPGVIVCHEWWGNTDYSIGRAKKLAELGYAAFALDVYGDGKTTTKVPEAQAMYTALAVKPGAMGERARAALAVLTARPEVDPKRLAAIGYCMGGTTALELARTGADLKAVVCFHTSNLAAADDQVNSRVLARILVCNGAADPFMTPEMIPTFERQMEAAGINYRIINYPGAMHSFTNPGVDAMNVDGARYNKAADEQSWKDMKAFFAETIDRK